MPSANPDFVHVPVWAALKYLTGGRALGLLHSIATIWPEKVLDVVRSVTLFKDESTGEPRDNFRTYFTFAELLGALPIRCITIADVGLIPTWLHSKYDRGLVPHALSKGLLKRLFDDSSAESAKKACAVIEACLELEHSSKRRKRSGDDLATVVDDYWLKEMLQAHAVSWEENRAETRQSFSRTAYVLSSRRNGAVTVARFGGLRSRTNPQNRDFYGPENRFVEGLRDVLDRGWLETAPVDTSEHVETALKGSSPRSFAG